MKENSFGSIAEITLYKTNVWILALRCIIYCLNI